MINSATASRLTLSPIQTGAIAAAGALALLAAGTLSLRPEAVMSAALGGSGPAPALASARGHQSSVRGDEIVSAGPLRAAELHRTSLSTGRDGTAEPLALDPTDLIPLASDLKVGDHIAITTASGAAQSLTVVDVRDVTLSARAAANERFLVVTAEAAGGPKTRRVRFLVEAAEPSATRQPWRAL